MNLVYSLRVFHSLSHAVHPNAVAIQIGKMAMMRSSNTDGQEWQQRCRSNHEGVLAQLA